jgi:hypothetical protein
MAWKYQHVKGKRDILWLLYSCMHAEQPAVHHLFLGQVNFELLNTVFIMYADAM